jgi:tetratricopeptide (TPR) repeat protein
MSAHLQRALLLMRQERADEAIREFHAVLAEDSGDATAHACLAMLQAERKDWKEADEHAREAVALTPDRAFSHYALSKVFFERGRFPEAKAAIEESIRLDPHDADSFCLLAAIHLSTSEWKKALAAADAGLAIDPEDQGCTTARSRALLLIGDRKAAAETIEGALRRNPDDAQTHTTQGWAMLHAGDPARAVDHFREALRLDPESGYARSGIVEALKARNPIYRRLLGYFLWMQKLPPRTRWGIVVGGFIVARTLARRQPASDAEGWLIGIFLAAYGAFVLLTWVGDSIFNLLLFLDPLGRHALDSDQRRGAILFGILLLVALSLAIAGFAGGMATLVSAAIAWGLTAMVSTTIHACQRGWPRWITVAAVSVVAALAAAMTAAAVAGAALGAAPEEVFDRGDARLAATLFFPAWFGTMILSQIMTGRRVRH